MKPCACIATVKSDGRFDWLCRCHEPTANESGDCDRCERDEHLLIPGDVFIVPTGPLTPLRFYHDPTLDLSLARAEEADDA